jgi:hypothetical protein
MNKYLLLSAAALVASAVSAKAGQQEFKFGTAGGGSYCDGGTGYWSGHLYWWIHTNADCAGAVYVGGPGIEGKTTRIGKNINMFDTAAFALGGLDCSIDFPPKFKSGILMPPTPENRLAGTRKSTGAAARALLDELRSKRGQTRR